MSAKRTSYAELAGLFLRLGATSFGGPAAHIANMHREVVERKQWLSRQEFLDLLGATNLIPGPNSTELAIHIGRSRAGIPGLVIAGTAFILPSALIVLAIAWLYVAIGVLPQSEKVLYGIKPVVIPIILHSIFRLGRVAVKSRELAILGLAAGVGNLAGVGELTVLFGAGFVALILARQQKRTVLPVAFVLPAAAALSTLALGIWPLFLYFLKVGSVLFGSGYLLVAFLQADLVDGRGWLTQSQLLDAVAIGQLTPGPLFTTATFIGYILLGTWGAVAATAGIFLPGFFFVALSHPFIGRLRLITWAQALLDGINVAAVALMLVMTWQIGSVAIVDSTTAGLALVGAVALVVFQVNSAWLVIGGAVVGLLS